MTIWHGFRSSHGETCLARFDSVSQIVFFGFVIFSFHLQFAGIPLSDNLIEVAVSLYNATNVSINRIS
jgi:hypothetical protein